MQEELMSIEAQLTQLLTEIRSLKAGLLASQTAHVAGVHAEPLMAVSRLPTWVAGAETPVLFPQILCSSGPGLSAHSGE